MLLAGQVWEHTVGRLQCWCSAGVERILTPCIDAEATSPWPAGTGLKQRPT